MCSARFAPLQFDPSIDYRHRSGLAKCLDQPGRLSVARDQPISSSTSISKSNRTVNWSSHGAGETYYLGSTKTDSTTFTRLGLSMSTQCGNITLTTLVIR
jgi:hypothetical protein